MVLKKPKRAGFFFLDLTHKPKLNELNPLLFLRIVRHCAFFDRCRNLTITANKINDIGIVPNGLRIYAVQRKLDLKLKT